MSNPTLTVNNAKLVEALSLIRTSIERRQTLPILSHVLLDAEGNSLTLVGTNTEAQMSARIPVQQAARLKTTCDAQKLYDITRLLPADALVNLSLSDEILTVKVAKSRYKLKTLPAADFPRVAAPEAVVRWSMPERELLGLLDDVNSAMAVNDVRYYLNGALLSVGEEYLTAVSTDGHRLAISRCASNRSNGKRDVILPRSVVAILGRMLSARDELVQIGLSENHIFVNHDEQNLVAKLIDGRFPDYQKVIPERSDHVARVNRLAFRDAVQRALVVAPEKLKGVQLDFTNGTLNITSNTADGEDSTEVLDIEYTGQDLSMGVNGQYLLDALDVLGGEQVTLEMRDPTSPIVAKGCREEPLHLIMPMRL